MEYFRKRQEEREKEQLNFYDVQLLRMKVFGIAGGVAIIGMSVLLPAGFFGPLSSRVKGNVNGKDRCKWENKWDLGNSDSY